MSSRVSRIVTDVISALPGVHTSWPRKWTGLALHGAACLLVSSIVIADVSYEKTYRVQALGTSGVLVAEGLAGVSVSGDQLRTAYQVKTISPAMKQLTPANDRSAIILLDSQQKLDLVPARLEYTETTLEEWRASLDYGNQDAEDSRIAAGLIDIPIDEEHCRWSLPVLSSTRISGTETIAGLEASLHLIEVQQTCEIPENGQVCSLAWRLEQWNTNEMPGLDEIRSARFGLAKALGGTDKLSIADTSAGRLMAMFRRGWNQVLYEAQSLDGFPVKSYMALEMSGERCTRAGTVSAETNESDWGTVGEIAKTTGKNTAKSQVASTAAQTVANSVGGGLGGMIARTVADSAARRGMDKVLEKEEETEEEEVLEPGFEEVDDSNVVLFTVSTELSNLSTEDLHPGLFELSPIWQKASGN